MPIHFEIDERDRIIVMVMEGHLTREDFLGYFAATERDPRFCSNMGRLIVATGALSYPASPEVPAVVDRLRQRAAGRTARYAVVADSPLNIGIANMVLGMAGLSERFELFSDRESARAWLRENAGESTPDPRQQPR